MLLHRRNRPFPVSGPIHIFYGPISFDLLTFFHPHPFTDALKCYPHTHESTIACFLFCIFSGEKNSMHFCTKKSRQAPRKVLIWSQTFIHLIATIVLYDFLLGPVLQFLYVVDCQGLSYELGRKCLSVSPSFSGSNVLMFMKMYNISGDHRTLAMFQSLHCKHNILYRTVVPMATAI